MLFYSASSMSSPARRLSAHIIHGSVNVTSLTGANTANITTFSANIEIKPSWGINVNKMFPLRSHFVIIGYCIFPTTGGMRCFERVEGTLRQLDDFKNASTLNGILLKANQTQNSLNLQFFRQGIHFYFTEPILS